MSIVNSVIDVGKDAATFGGELAAAKVSGRGTVENLGILGSNDNTRVTLTHRSVTEATTNIFAYCPANFSLDLSADWAPRNGAGTLNDYLGGGTNKVVRSLTALSKMSGLGATTLKYMTAHYWEGSAPVRGTIPFEFIAENDPQSEVIRPMTALYKMTAPAEFASVLIAPGPSVLGTATAMGEKISIQIGNILYFDNVVINNVTSEIDTRLSFGNEILHAKVDVMFTSFFTVSRKDIKDMFLMDKGESSSNSNFESSGDWSVDDYVW